MRRALPLAAVVVLAGMLPATGPAAAPAAMPDPDLACGHLAPLVNACGQCCAEFEDRVDVEITMSAFVGRVELRLRAVPNTGAWSWQCSAAGLAAVPGTGLTPAVPLLGCGPKVVTGRGLRDGDDVRLDCYAWPLLAAAPLPPPLGSYGCKAWLPDDD